MPELKTTIDAPRDIPPGDRRRLGAPASLDDRFLAEDGRIYLTGVQALVRMLLDRQRHDERHGHAGSLHVSGYEGSPLAGYDLEIQRHAALTDPTGSCTRLPSGLRRVPWISSGGA
jgi:hypothetical protein